MRAATISLPRSISIITAGWFRTLRTRIRRCLTSFLALSGTSLGSTSSRTRLIVCGFAAAGLFAVLRLTQRLIGPAAAVAVTLLAAVYPIWFAQSTLAHADIFAAAFTLWAFALYVPEAQGADLSTRAEGARRRIAVAALFTFAVLSKETAIIEPATLAAFELFLVIRDPSKRAEHMRWLAAFSFPLLPLLCWYAYHHHVTGFTFGNPEYLRYNATANFTAAHILQAVRYRFLHLFWQRNIWLPILIAFACLFLPRRLPAKPYTIFAVPCLLIVTNWLAFSVLGGALLTRYLLPIYPLILILCVDVWRARTRWWPAFTAFTAVAFIAGWWLNPPTSFAPEDNLTYRDMVVVHQQAIQYVADHYPDATVLSAWPVTADLFNPYLGYTTTPIKAVSVEDFTRPSLQTFADDLHNTGSAKYDTAIVFTTHFLEPNFRRYLITHPDTQRGREFAAAHDLSPQEIATLLHGTVVIEYERHGEWAAVLRFNRSYEARLIPLR